MAARLYALALGVAVVMLVAGCGGGGSGGSTTDTTAATVQGVRVLRVIDVHETEWKLTPSSIRIERFGYYGLRGVNDGTVAHALRLSGPGIPGKTTAEIPPGDSKTMLVFFRRVGTYALTCPIDGHEQKGMKATVTVH